MSIDQLVSYLRLYNSAGGNTCRTKLIHRWKEIHCLEESKDWTGSFLARNGRNKTQQYFYSMLFFNFA